jgi:hypothetical protein
MEAVMAQIACHKLTDFYPPEAATRPVDKALAWIRALFPIECRVQRYQPNAALARADSLREAAISLSLGDGVRLTGHEYPPIEQLWGVDK